MDIKRNSLRCRLKHLHPKLSINFILLGLVSLIQLLFRTGTKLSRIQYSCQRMVLTGSTLFLSSISTYLGSLSWVKKFKKDKSYRRKLLLNTLSILFVIAFTFTAHDGYAQSQRLKKFDLIRQSWTQSSTQGNFAAIYNQAFSYPTSVVSVRDWRATNWPGSNSQWQDVWGYDDNQVNQQVVDNLAETSLRQLSLTTPLQSVADNKFTYAQASVPAFPGAEGGGAGSVGGRGGRIIEVTNLNSDGPGSLRAACEASGPRIVVFRVAGIIDLNGNRITISNPYITIAGQTAPGGGITIKGHELRIQTHDVIVRYLRVRPGRGNYGTGTGDAIALGSSCYNVIIDHCSVSWSNDENIQIWSGNTPSHNVTFSWNIIAEGLTYEHASCGLIVGSDVNAVGIHSISIHHNIFMHGNNRFPLVKGKDARVINNLMYNWNWWPTGFRGGIELDIIGNRYKMGPSTPASANYEIWNPTGGSTPNYGVPGDPSLYIKGNIGPSQSNPNGDNWGMLMRDISRSYERSSPMSGSTYPITIHSVLDVEDLVLNDAGASKRLDEYGNLVVNRDPVDIRLIQEYRNGTGKIPVDENSVGGYPTIDPGTPYLDSDHDGMPDKWEILYGFSPADASNSSQDTDGDGYTNVEEFLNGTNPINLQTCAEQSGHICQPNQTCSGTWLSASDSDRCCSISCTISIPEDLNEDGEVNSIDLQICVNAALGVVPNPRADVNGDGKVDSFDIQQIVRKILGR